MGRKESETLEFKLRIDRQRKIAKTLVAFANGSGGTLLVGVRDNGSVAGCRAEEELFMIEGAASRYARPEVAFTPRVERSLGKEVLVIDVARSEARPHSALEEGSDLWVVYVRRGPANFRANRVLIREMNLKSQDDLIVTERHLGLLPLVPRDQGITASKLARLAKLPILEVEKGLASLLHWGQISALPSERGWTYLSAE